MVCGFCAAIDAETKVFPALRHVAGKVWCCRRCGTYYRGIDRIATNAAFDLLEHETPFKDECTQCAPIGDSKTIENEFDTKGELVGVEQSFPHLLSVCSGVRRCQTCGMYFHYKESIKALQGGPDYVSEETLRRISPQAARELAEKERRFLNSED